MNLHEYQAKNLLKQFNVPVPEGMMAEKVSDAVSASRVIAQKTGIETWAVKAQIHAGGRGKGGGVKIAKTFEEVEKFAGQILGMTLVTHQTGPKGKLVRKLLIEQSVYYPGPEPVKEFYMSILLNRQTSCNTIIYSTQGGMNIEEVAERTPELIYREEIDPSSGIHGFQLRKIAYNLNLHGKAHKLMHAFVTALYNAYLNSDASLVEINPVMKTSDDMIIAADAKIVLDDSAIFRHPTYFDWRDTNEEDPFEVEASQHNLNFIKLDGNVGCMVNGAGLAMATMDIIRLSGGMPANFLDVGGGANPKTVEAGFRIILKDENVKAILINIFGGIVRCDRVANGVVEAYHSIGEINVPVIVRLQGTNAVEAKDIIDRSGLKVYSAITLEEAAKLVSQHV